MQRTLEELSGLEMLQGIVDGTLPPAPISETLDFHPVEVSEGKVVFTGNPAPEHYNPIGTVHGGYASTLLDSAMACAVHSTLEPGWAYTTLDLQVKFVRPITADTGEIRAVGVLVHRGRTQGIAEGRLVRAADGALLAHGTTTCLVFQR